MVQQPKCEVYTEVTLLNTIGLYNLLRSQKNEKRAQGLASAFRVSHAGMVMRFRYVMCRNLFHRQKKPMLHELQSKASVKGWSKLRMGMLLSAVNTSAMPSNQLCLVCCEPATLRCQQCGPLIHYCFSKQHEKVNFFHVPEKWEVKLWQCRNSGCPQEPRIPTFYVPLLIGSPGFLRSLTYRESRILTFPYL